MSLNELTNNLILELTLEDKSLQATITSIIEKATRQYESGKTASPISLHDSNINALRRSMFIWGKLNELKGTNIVVFDDYTRSIGIGSLHYTEDESEIYCTYEIVPLEDCNFVKYVKIDSDTLKQIHIIYRGKDIISK